MFLIELLCCHFVPESLKKRDNKKTLAYHLGRLLVSFLTYGLLGSS